MASISAKRHAQAVFELALQKNELDKWQTDLHTLSASLSDPKLVSALENPKMPFTSKTKLIEEVTPGVGRLPHNLAFLLTEKGRLGMLPEVEQEYTLLLNAHRGIARARLTSAVPLTDKQKEKVVQTLSTLSNKKVVADTKIDPEIMGGVIAQIGDTLIDGSVRTQLALLKKALAQGAA